MSTFLKQPLTLCLSLLTLSFTTSDSRALNFYDGWNMEAPMQSPHFFFLLIDHHSFIANIGAISFSLCLPVSVLFCACGCVQTSITTF